VRAPRLPSHQVRCSFSRPDRPVGLPTSRRSDGEKGSLLFCGAKFCTWHLTFNSQQRSIQAFRSETEIDWSCAQPKRMIRLLFSTVWHCGRSTIDRHCRSWETFKRCRRCYVHLHLPHTYIVGHSCHDRRTIMIEKDPRAVAETVFDVSETRKGNKRRIEA
jgi:hypothetical protein